MSGLSEIKRIMLSLRTYLKIIFGEQESAYAKR